MSLAGKISADTFMPSARNIRTTLLIIFVAVLFATCPFILSKSLLSALHQTIKHFPNMPVPRTCEGGYAAVDAEGHACISLRNFTLRTSIFRARTPEITYMYCSIPKNGCSFHIDILHRVNGDLFPGASKHMKVNQGKILINDEEEAAELLHNSSVPKYMVIRNPMTRVLSAYLCKVERYLPEIEQNPASFHKWAREELTSLTSWQGVNEHWQAQTAKCGYDMRDIYKKFHVFRVEEPAEYVDFLYKIIPNRILEKGWGRKKTSYRDFVLSPHVRTGHTEEKFYDYVGTLEMFDFLEKIYRKDIDVLGYREEVTEMRKELARITGRVATNTTKKSSIFDS